MILHRIRVFLVITFNVCFFTLTVFPISLVVLGLNAGRRLKCTSFSWKISAKALFRSLNTKIICIDKRDEETRNLNNPHGLYISNHQSMMDIPLLLTRFVLPPIMKKSILYVPIFGICAYGAGSIIVDRKDRNSRRQALKKSMQRLNEFHKGIQYYPEGHRNRDADSPKERKRIKTALLSYAYKSNIGTHAISICKNNDFFNKKDIIKFNNTVGLMISEEIRPQNFETEEEFICYCWDKVSSGYFELEGKLNSETM